MPRIQHVLFVGIYNSVVALDPKDGSEVWRQKLGGMSFVNVYFDGEDLFAATKGELFCLDRKTGAVMWHNKLKGLGTGYVTMASTRMPGASGQQAASVAAAVAAQARNSASS